MRMIDGDALEREGWSLYRNYQQDKNTMVYETKSIAEIPTAQPEHLTDDDFETIRIHLSAYKEKLCNQRRWKEAEEYQRIIDRFMSFSSAQPEQRWIPCSERLPEKEGLYLVSGDSEIWICRFICLRFFRGWSNPANCPVVKAWMPLPYPYQPERETDGCDSRSNKRNNPCD